VTLTSTARASARSLGEVGIPAPQQGFSVVLDQALNPTDLSRLEPATVLEPNRVEPELGGVLIALDVDVRRLGCVAGVEVEAIRS